MTLDEALAALNDHLGEQVTVIVGMPVIDRPMEALVMVSAEGVLSHWSEQPEGAVGMFPHIGDSQDQVIVGAPESDAFAGVYRVGDDTSIYLLEGWVTSIAQAEHGIAFALAPNVSMTVAWGVAE